MPLEVCVFILELKQDKNMVDTVVTKKFSSETTVIKKNSTENTDWIYRGL
jgi:hypothetical protein